MRTPFGGGKSQNLAALRHALGSRKALEVLPEAAGLPDTGKVDVAECHWGQGHFIFNLHFTIQIPALWPLRPWPAAGLGLASLPVIRSIVSMNRALPSG